MRAFFVSAEGSAPIRCLTLGANGPALSWGAGSAAAVQVLRAPEEDEADGEEGHAPGGGGDPQVVVGDDRVAEGLQRDVRDLAARVDHDGRQAAARVDHRGGHPGTRGDWRGGGGDETLVEAGVVLLWG